MTNSSKNEKWTVEQNTDVLIFPDFASALAYADGAAATKALMKVIEPERNNIKVVPEKHKRASIESV